MTDELGRRVTDLRRRRGMTQAALGSAIGISPSYLSLLEKGRRRPSAKVARALAAALGTTVEHLTTGRGGEARTLDVDLRFAEVALSVGDAVSARDRYAAAREQAVALGDAFVPEQYEGLFGLARADEALGDLTAAVHAFETLLAAPDLPSSVNRATVKVGLCRAYAQLGDLGRAIDLGEAALAEAGPLNGDAVVGDELVELASTLVGAYLDRGDLTRAAMLIESTVSAAEVSSSMRARGAAYWNAAQVAEQRGEIRSALRYAERAMALYGEIGYAFAVAALRGNVAGYAIRLPGADLAAAEQQLRQSIGGMAAAGGSPADLAAVERELARCCLLSGQIEEATRVARVALGRVEAVALERARAQAILAAALLAGGSAEDALAAYEDAAVALEALGAVRHAAPVWRDLAAVLKAMGRTEETIAALERAVAALGIPAAPIRPVAVTRA
ncbi:MAG: helix-turn-helix domain-containing protein [Frankiaceae bacterium]